MMEVKGGGKHNHCPSAKPPAPRVGAKSPLSVAQCKQPEHKFINHINYLARLAKANSLDTPQPVE